jgi:uncharacterized protein with HEPN domain
MLSMPSEKESGAIRDMLFNINPAERFAHGQTFEGLRDDLMRLYAIIRSLKIISEASRRLSDELKARYPDIPWREMAAAGDFYRHNYEDVTPRRVWKTLQEDLSSLRAMIEQELSSHSAE